ncbi:uncharacterized protein LOC127579935 isoform X2 [Pristis pectinata]|nr:uncharacterized protein LOC127579935 isoform X2 [Pristis pectinata]XP_051888963.1 uncharacterized protein LOC127579935 isoform X2 [Pristis pectinata]
MESYEEFSKAHLAQIKAKVTMEKNSLPATSSRGSLIRFHGVAVLSPLLSSEQRKEIREYQLKVRSSSKTSDEKLAEAQRSTSLLKVHGPLNREASKLLHSLLPRKEPSVEEIREHYSFPLMPNMPVGTELVTEMINVGDWKTTTTMQQTSVGHRGSPIFEPHFAQITDEVGEACSTNLERDRVPVIMISDLINENPGISNYHTSSSCLDQLLRKNPKVNSCKYNDPESDDFEKTAVHALQNVTVHQLNDATKCKATNSTSKQAKVDQVGSDDSIVITGDNETSNTNLGLLHLPTEETNLSGDSSSKPIAPSLQSLLKKSREYRNKQRQQKMLKNLHFKGEAEKLSDKKNNLCASKVCKNTRGRRIDSGKAKLPNTLLTPDPALPSASSLHFTAIPKHNYISVASDVSPAKTTELLSWCHTLPEENKDDKMDDVEPSHNFMFSEQPQGTNTSSCSKRNPVCSNSEGQVSQCQEGGKQVNRSVRSQNRGFMVPNIALSGSPVLSRKWTCSSQRLLVNAPVNVGSEMIDQQEKNCRSDSPKDQPKINQAQQQYITELEVNLDSVKALITDLQTTLTSSCDVTMNEQLLNDKATTRQRIRDSFGIKCTQNDNEIADVAVAELFWNKRDVDPKFPSSEDSIPQAVNSAPAAFQANSLQKMHSQQLFVQNSPTASALPMGSLRPTFYMATNRIAKNPSINKSYDVDFPSSLWTQNFKLKQEVDNSKLANTPELGPSVLDHRVKRKLMMGKAQ